MATFESSLKPRLIYVFAIADNQHEGSLKIGETTLADNIDPASTTPNSENLNKAAKERIDQYTKTAGISYELLYTELTLYIRGGRICSFNDKQVHNVLERSGVKRKEFKGATEWYSCDLETVKRAITAIKGGRRSDTYRKSYHSASRAKDRSGANTQAVSQRQSDAMECQNAFW